MVAICSLMSVAEAIVCETKRSSCSKMPLGDCCKRIVKFSGTGLLDCLYVYIYIYM